jgi:hypothetical protein
MPTDPAKIRRKRFRPILKSIPEEIYFLPEFNSTSVNKRYTQHNENIKRTNIRQLQYIYPEINKTKIEEIYNSCIQLQKVQITNTNSFLVQMIKDFLKQNEIPYKSQVAVNYSGIIIEPFKKTKKIHFIDFVIGNDIRVGRNISEFIVLSCKTSSKDKWATDNWMNTALTKPKKYILLTLCSEYPKSIRFQESNTRKIITSKPRLNDDRIFHLGYSDLLDELTG